MVKYAKRAVDHDAVVDEADVHPLGSGLGAAGGAASGAVAGAVVGSVAGPLGTVAGSVAGAVVGGLAGAEIGAGIAELVNPTEVEEYYRVRNAREFDLYKPAYRFGYDARLRYPERRFTDVESDLKSEWERDADAALQWEQAKDQVRDSFDYTDRLYKERLAKR